MRFAERPHRDQILPLSRDYRAARPVPIGRKRREALELRHDGPRLRDRITARRQDLHPPPRDRVQLFPRTARRVLVTRPVDVDGMPGLHPFVSQLDHRVGGRHDVARGTVVCSEISRPGSVIRLETADKLHRGAVEGIDILIVIADREQGELAGIFLERSPRQGRYQFVLVRPYILVLVHQYPAEPRQQTLAEVVRLLGRQALSAQ